MQQIQPTCEFAAGIANQLRVDLVRVVQFYASYTLVVKLGLPVSFCNFHSSNSLFEGREKDFSLHACMHIPI